MRVPSGKVLMLGIWPASGGWGAWRPRRFRNVSNVGAACGDGAASGLGFRSGFRAVSCVAPGRLGACFAGVFSSGFSAGCFAATVLRLVSTFFSVFDSLVLAGSAGTAVACEVFAG